MISSSWVQGGASCPWRCSSCLTSNGCPPPPPPVDHACTWRMHGGQRYSYYIYFSQGYFYQVSFLLTTLAHGQCTVDKDIHIKYTSVKDIFINISSSCWPHLHMDNAQWTKIFIWKRLLSRIFLLRSPQCTVDKDIHITFTSVKDIFIKYLSWWPHLHKDNAQRTKISLHITFTTVDWSRDIHTEKCSHKHSHQHLT